MSNPAQTPAKKIPRLRIGLNVGLQIALALFLLIGANYIGFNYYQRWDFSRSQKFSLATQTTRILSQLKQPARVVVFFSPSLLTPESEIYPDLVALLKELQFVAKDKLEVEFVDPNRNPTRARELQAQYKFSFLENVVIVDYDGRSQFVPAADMVVLDPTASTFAEMRPSAFRGEEALVGAFMTLLNPRQAKIYFLQGHGEPRIEGQSPLSIWRTYLERLNAQVLPLNLSVADTVPDDATMVIIAGARFDLSGRELELLRSYWNERGRLLVLLDPNANTPNLHALLRGAGIEPRNDRVLRTIQLGFAIGILRDVSGHFLLDSEITKRLVDVNAYFPGATQSLLLHPEEAQKQAIRLRPLIQASEGYWGESDYVTDGDAGVAFEPDKDLGAPITLAASAERGGISDDRVEVTSAKMIAVGNSDFSIDSSLDGANVASANLDFLVSSATWLMDRGRLTGIVAKSPTLFTLNLSDRQLTQLGFYIMLAIPAMAALLGGFSWWSRRR